MAEGDGSSIGIDARGIEAGELHHGERLRGEGFVQFNDACLIEFESGELEGFGNGEHRADAHFFRRASGGGEGDESCERLGANGAGAQSGHHDGGGSAVGHLRTVSGGDDSFGVEGGLEFGERFERSVGARAFVGVEIHSAGVRAIAVAVHGSESDFDGDNFDLEFSGGDGGEGLLMALEGKFVGLFARDAVFFGEIFGGEAHAEVGVGIMVHEPRIGRNFVAAHGNHAHGFGAAGENDFGLSGDDAFGGYGDGLQAGGAEAVDGHGGGFDGQSGAEGGDAGDVHALLGFRHGAAEDDVFDLFGIEAGDAGQRRANGDGGEVVGARRAQRAFKSFADGGADGTDDYG